MSYILDALQRAEAERGQGQVPGLHSPPPPPHHTPSPTAARPGRQWVVAATLLACVVALVLWLGLLGAPAPQAVPAPAPAPAPTESAVAPPPDTTRPPVPPPRLATAPVPAPLAVAQPTAPRVEAPPSAEASPKAIAPSAPPKRPPPAEKTPPNKAATPASTHPVPLLAELPEALRRDVPALHITGAVYSANPAQRLLVVNNQVLNQGSQAAPGVVLEEIQPHSAVFSANGTRFRLNH